jgi:PIN domain nuclease of toxin-antitoxin system
VRGLVDTHALIWFLNDDGRLGRAARAFMRSGENELLMGLGSCWELAIKCSIGKITLSKPFD